MPTRQTLPDLWLLSDARNDARLEAALARLPRGSGFVFRHYHLWGDARRERYDTLVTLCRARDHLVVLAGDAETACEWGADGIYADPAALGEGEGLLRLAMVHDADEIALAGRAGADAMFLSPVFPTRSHPGAEGLGKSRFLELAARATAPVIALGGMTAERAADLGWPRWAAIDGLS
jgi:thiamine-phosphate pyrophosphorylase